ncbi:MAG: Gx transporter family protein [Clostridia bacterium]|nr:Gx transporter family protein [Clostridia bacterium]
MPLPVRSRTRRLTVAAMTLACALILSYLESLVPLSFALPGMKLGLANVAIMFAFFRLGRTTALVVSLCRVLVTALLFGQASSFFFALLGALFSFFVLLFLSHLGDRISRIGISVACAAAHGVGQITAATILYGTFAMISYLPFLLFAALPFGALCGFLLILCERAVPGEVTD